MVTRLEREARSDPDRYRRNVLMLALSGYAYIGGILLLSLALFVISIVAVTEATLLAIKLVIVFGAFFLLVIRAMWVKLPPPEGREVTREEAPQLFKLLDSLLQELQVSTRFHHVLITDDFNAGVVQVPRLGILGWHRNYMLIGLPLMKVLTLTQLAAVLAHEIGHLAGGHGSLGNWLYRLRLGWRRLVEMLQQTQSLGSFLFRPFFSRYVPYFTAYSFPLARANEYEADRNAARLTSPAAVAAALTTVNVMGNFLQGQFWPQLHKKAEDYAKPQFSPFSDMGPAMSGSIDDVALQRWLSEAMGQKTSVFDTHPALADRLNALGQGPQLAPPQSGESADLLLGAALQPVTKSFDRSWQEGIAQEWEHRHQQVQGDRKRLLDLDRGASEKVLTFDERLQRALLTENIAGRPDTALEQLRHLHRENPEHATVCFALGARLLQQDDEAGAALIEHSLNRDDDAIAPGAELLRNYYAHHGREIEAWHQRWVERQEVLSLAQTEREQITANDKFEPHGITDKDFDQLRLQLSAIPGIRAAWLMRKQVKHLPEHPQLVLGFTTPPWWSLRSKNNAHRTMEAIVNTVVGFPYPIAIICLEGENALILGAMLKVADG